MRVSTIRKTISFIPRYARSYFAKGGFICREVPVLHIETTNICDAKCVFCANVIMRRKREHLQMQLFQKAVDEFVAMEGRELTFNAVIGEPLLDPYLLSRIRYVTQFPQIQTLGFITNLQWLHTIDIDELLDSGITWLAISTVFSGREKFLEFFKVDRYEQTIKNIIALLKANNARNKRLVIKFSIKPTNEPLKDIMQHPDFKIIDSLTDHVLSASLREQGLCVDDWLGAVKLPSYLWRRPRYPRFFRPCKLLYGSLMIFSNGTIGACPCRDFEAESDLILGHIGSVSLQEVWQGETIETIRSHWRKKNKIPNICRACSHYVY